MSASGISAEERDALYDLVLDKLSAIDDLGLAISRQDYSRAEQLGGVYHDYLTLMLCDLGWSEHGDAVESLSTPPAVLARVMVRLREAVESPYAFVERDRSAAEQLERRSRLVLEACRRVLSPCGEPAASK